MIILSYFHFKTNNYHSPLTLLQQTMVSKNLCGFITTNGKACKCYKMKDAEFCKSHHDYDWGSDIESASDSASDSRLEELESSFKKLQNDVTVMKAKIQRTNFIQMILYTYLLSVFLYHNVQSEDVHLIVNDLTHCANVIANYTMDVVKDTQSFIKNYSVYNHNYKVCFI